MLAYINPPHGNDTTGIVAATESAARAHPFKTPQAAIEAIEASKQKHPHEPHTLKETHKPIIR